MEKDRRSGQPNHSRPLASRSGSRPENTVMEASDTAATFSVITRRATTVSPFPPNRSDTRSRYPVCVNTPMPNRKRTSGAIFAKEAVMSRKRNSPSSTRTSCRNQGTTPKNRYHRISSLGSSLAITVSLFPYAFFST